MANKLIVIEGIDGSGESSTGRKLAKLLGADFCQTPMGTWRNQKECIRKRNVLIRFIFYFLSNFHSSTKLALMLEKNNVVCDRYIHSTWAYHTIYGLKFLRFIPICLLPIKRPDYVFCLQVSKQERERRINERSDNNHHHDLDSETLEKVQAEYLRYKEITVISTDGLSTIEVAEKISQIINPQPRK